MKLFCVFITFCSLLTVRAHACGLGDASFHEAVAKEFPNATNLKYAPYSEGWIGLTMNFYVTFTSDGKDYVGLIQFSQLTCELEGSSKFAQLEKY